MNFSRELIGVWSLEWRRLRSSPRVVILALLYLLCSALLLSFLGQAAAFSQDQLKQAVSDPEQMAEAVSRMRVGVLSQMFTGTSPENLEDLARIPLVVFFGFRATLFFVPIWVALLGFDAISEELSTRSIRYLSLRARRTAIVLGKFLTLAVVLAVVLGVLTGLLIGYARYLNSDFTGSLLAFTFFRLWAAATLFALGYLGLTLLVSALVASPAIAIALNLVALVAFWVLDWIGSGIQKVAVALEKDVPIWAGIRYASPSHYGPLLLHPDPSQVRYGALAFAMVVLLTVAGASLLLERRDV